MPFSTRIAAHLERSRAHASRPRTPVRAECPSSSSRSSSGSEIIRIPAHPHLSPQSSSPSPMDDLNGGLFAPPQSKTHSAITTPGLGQTPNATILTIGHTGKSFAIHTDLLTSRSPVLRRLLEPATTTTTTNPFQPLAFRDLDEFSFALFARWIYGGALGGPYDFHSMQHYIGLYCLAQRFEIERLANEVMDLVRAYYRNENMTAPPFRLSFIYKNTERACAMRAFLAESAVYRVLCLGKLSQVMQDLVEDGGELARDLMSVTVRMHAEGVPDPRARSDCVYHEHENSIRCRGMDGELVLPALFKAKTA